MSLVITSNVDRDNTINQQGINLPYSYTNSMDNLKIPANSEIAVQSVKVNRDPSIALVGNEDFACAFNKPIDAYPSQMGTPAGVAFEPIAISTDRIAFPVGGKLRNEFGLEEGTYLPRDLKTLMNKSLEFATFPPMFKKGSLNVSGVEVNSSINANGEVIFTYDFNSVLNASLSNNASTLAGEAITTNIDFGDDTLYTTTLTNSASSGSLIVSNTTENTEFDDNIIQRPTIFTKKALSNAGGEWEIDLTQSIQGSNGHTDADGIRAQQWAIGLTRPQVQRPYKEQIGDPSVFFLSPPWYDEYDESGEGDGLGAEGTSQYWDWVVKNEYNPVLNVCEITIFHAVADADEGNQTFLYEVQYVSGLGADKTDKFRVGNASFGIDAKEIDTLKFKVSNEVMEITLSNRSGPHTWTISSNQYSGTNNGVSYSASLAKQMLKPVNQNCWNLYPKVMLAPYKLGAAPVNASAKNTITFTNYDGYTLNTPQGTTATYNGIITELTSGRPKYYLPNSKLGLENSTNTPAFSDFACYYLDTLYHDDFIETGQSLSLDVSNIMKFLGSDSTQDSTWNPQWRSLANDTLDVLPALLLEYATYAEDSNLQRGYGQVGTLTVSGLNSRDLFGFERPIVDNFTQSSSNGLRNYTITADKTSRHLPAVANFVRVKNLTQQTFNMANKAFSKILYCIPRFDNTGSDTGNLFFEANEKTYVKLNNTTEINVNSLDIDLVSADERIATNYVGQTVVIFHIRKSRD